MVRSGFINAQLLIGRSVVCLHLQNNAVDDTMLVAMASAWKVHVRSVRNEGGEMLRLKRLDLSGNPAIGDAGVVALASSIDMGAAPALEWLSLAKLGFGSDGAKAVAATLCTSLSPRSASQTAGTDVDSGSESSSDRSALVPEASNTSCCALETLILSGNRVGVGGKSAVAEALGRQGCSLTELQMSRMQWDCDGAALLAKALERNSKLTSLDLGGNALGLKGICSLGWALSEHNQTLISLQLWNNSGLGISGNGPGEEQSDIDEVLRTIDHTLKDNVRSHVCGVFATDSCHATCLQLTNLTPQVRLTAQRKQLEHDRQVALARAR